MSGLEIAAAAAGMAGAGLQAYGTIAGANAASKMAETQNWNNINATRRENMVLQNRANEERAAATRQAYEASRTTQQVQSKLQANAAAQGGSATDDTVAQLGGQINQQGTYEKLMQLYGGESRARGMEDLQQANLYKAINQGSADMYSAGVNKRNSYLSAGGTLLSTASSLGMAASGRGKYPSAGTGVTN